MKKNEFMELNALELESVNGGFWFAVVKWIALAILWDTINDPKSAGKNFKEGLLAD